MEHALFKSIGVIFATSGAAEKYPEGTATVVVTELDAEILLAD